MICLDDAGLARVLAHAHRIPTPEQRVAFLDAFAERAEKLVAKEQERRRRHAEAQRQSSQRLANGRAKIFVEIDGDLIDMVLLLGYLKEGEEHDRRQVGKAIKALLLAIRRDPEIVRRMPRRK
jgi:uncharacterized protein YueI